MLHIYANAKVGGTSWEMVMTRPIPRMENGTTDSMSIAATLVYMLDISGESTSRASDPDPKVHAQTRNWRRYQASQTRSMRSLTQTVAVEPDTQMGQPGDPDVIPDEPNALEGVAHTQTADVEPNSTREVANPNMDAHACLEGAEPKFLMDAGRLVVGGSGRRGDRKHRGGHRSWP